MAKVMKDDARENACNEINTLLEEVKTINGRITSSAPYVIECGKRQGIRVDDNLGKKIQAVLRTQRERTIKDIKSKAEKFRIELDDEELALISDTAIAKE